MEEADGRRKGSDTEKGAGVERGAGGGLWEGRGGGGDLVYTVGATLVANSNCPVMRQPHPFSSQHAW